ncbi:CRISPR-associated helicase/endonuclease Cas3 [Bradymonas sediminis]|uniref:CRISPR-associated helicase/endonuclease Cas3 n=2 Tax=Bradymonas sediminis TaxID=1548548 RepID=A0A2Z4FQH5_9DELT|nr:CRISPR-associated helicase/endonuclease Cas3 [Bradymonas sediminis]
MAHSADVAAMLEALLEHTILGRRLGHLLGQEHLSPAQTARLCVLAALHDVGKVNHGFQARALDKKAPPIGHVAPLINFLRTDDAIQGELVEALGVREIAGWFGGEQEVIAFLLATWGHHGRPVEPQPGFRAHLWRKKDAQSPVQGIEDLRRATEAWFPQAFDDAPAFRMSSEFLHAYNGVLTLADWMGSDEQVFCWRDDESNRIEFAREQARQALQKMGLNPARARASLGEKTPEFAAVSPFPPYEIQRVCAELPIHQNGSLTVLESDTGSGKTEAAIARFIRLFHAGEVDGMYFALPTRTAATQLYRRVVETLERAFPDPEIRPPAVLAVPGYLEVDGTQAVQRLPHFRVLWPDQSRHRWRGWAAEQPKRYLAGAVAVGTIDQALLSGLKVGHAHLRASALLRHLLVVDEVHASDTYMTRLLETVLDHHLNAGGHALLMSATLGSATRTRLVTRGRQQPPGLEEAAQEPYPLLTHVDGRRREPVQLHAPSSDYSKTVQIDGQQLAEHPAEIARVAVAAAKKGARVLIIRNTVATCRQVQLALEDEVGSARELLFDVGGVPAPHHSRFAGVDRVALDQAIEANFGKDTARAGCVAVATQTVEQSLDIDADLLLSDLCPVDVLLQRIGRLHRHDRRARPGGFSAPKLVVLLPDERDLGAFIQESGQGRGPCGLGTVYSDMRMLEATWRLIEQKSTWTIPAMNRELVERATHPEGLAEIVSDLGGAWVSHAICMGGTEFADRALADLNLIDRTILYGDSDSLFSSDLDERIKTRLGEGDRRVRIEDAVIGPFGEATRELTLPAFMANHAADDSNEQPEEFATEIRVEDDALYFDFAGQSYRYDRLGIQLHQQ